MIRRKDKLGRESCLAVVPPSSRSQVLLCISLSLDLDAKALNSSTDLRVRAGLQGTIKSTELLLRGGSFTELSRLEAYQKVPTRRIAVTDFVGLGKSSYGTMLPLAVSELCHLVHPKLEARSGEAVDVHMW